MDKHITLTLIATLILTTAQSLVAMPNAQTHVVGIPDQAIGGMKDLLRTSAHKGGAAGLTKAQLLKQSKYMDYYATQIGKIANRRGGGMMAPANHATLRHNPIHVSKSLSGDGTVNLARRNVARVHKIQDAYYNSFKSNVDGWRPNSKIKADSKRILRFLKRHGRLPKDLPYWVDNSGPYLKGVKRSPTVTEAFRGRSAGLKLPRAEKVKLQNVLDFTYGKKTLRTRIMTPQMRNRMHDVLEYVQRNGKLPKSIPSWLDDAISPTGTVRNLPKGSIVIRNGVRTPMPTRTSMPKIELKRFSMAKMAFFDRQSVGSLQITPKMRVQAKSILKFVKHNGRLPKTVPPWVDDMGSALIKTKGPLPSSSGGGRTSWNRRLGQTGGKAARALGIATVCAFVALDGYLVVQRCREIDRHVWDGFITPEQGARRKGEEIGRRIGALLFGFVGFWGVSTLTSGNVWLGLGAAIICAEIGERVGGWVGNKAGGLWAKWHAEEDRRYVTSRRATTRHFVATSGTHHIPANVYRDLGFAPEVCHAIERTQ